MFDYDFMSLRPNTPLLFALIFNPFQFWRRLRLFLWALISSILANRSHVPPLQLKTNHAPNQLLTFLFRLKISGLLLYIRKVKGQRHHSPTHLPALGAPHGWGARVCDGYAFRLAYSL